MKLIRHLFNSFVDFLFPKSELIQKLELLDDNDLIALLRQHPEKREPAIPGIISLFPYRDPVVHDLLHEIKYSANNVLAQKISPALYETCLPFAPACITFIPQTQNRKEKRGFDQGQLILKTLKEYDMHLNKSCRFIYERNLLKWNRHVTQQSLTQSKEERLQNMHEALECLNSKAINNKTIIVLDDVCTTGATLMEAKRVLEKAGATKVILLTIAH